MIQERQRQSLSDILERIELTKRDRTDLEFYIDKKESENSNDRLTTIEDYVGISRGNAINITYEEIGTNYLNNTDFIKLLDNTENRFIFKFESGFKDEKVIIQPYFYDENKNLIQVLSPIFDKYVNNGEYYIYKVPSYGRYVKFSIKYPHYWGVLNIYKYPDNELFAILSNNEIDMITNEIFGIEGSYGTYGGTGSGISLIGEI